MSYQTYTPQEEPPQRENKPFKIWIPALVLLLLAIFLIFNDNQAATPKDLPGPTSTPAAQSALEMLLYTQLPQMVEEAGHSNWSLDEVQFNESNTQALLWMAQAEEGEDEVLAREPEIVLATLDLGDDSWR